jgi:2-polyprenyl-3-methyl-5-hydroxy-6-metoxy-1,4-benzoquinol methylase
MNGLTDPVTDGSDHSASALAGLASELYAAEPSAKIRLSQRYRPYICPFDQVIAQVPESARVLDVGCGSGLFLLLLAKLGRIEAGHGFDVSAPAISAARNAAARQALTATLSFEERPVEAGIPEVHHSVVTVLDVIHHIPPPHQQAFVAALCAATPAGGRLIIKDMVHRPIWRATANRLHDLVMARQWVHHLQPGIVADWCLQNGMRLVHQTSANTLWYGHWMLVLDRQ